MRFFSRGCDVYGEAASALIESEGRRDGGTGRRSGLKIVLDTL